PARLPPNPRGRAHTLPHPASPCLTLPHFLLPPCDSLDGESHSLSGENTRAMPPSFRASEGRILIATSYPADAFLLRAAAGRAGVPVAFAEDGVTAMRELCRRPGAYVGVIVSDRVGRVSGLSLCGLARDAGCNLPILLLTADGWEMIAARAVRLGVSV